MSDLVEEARDAAVDTPIPQDADLLTRLADRVEELETALRQIAETDVGLDDDEEPLPMLSATAAWQVARQALITTYGQVAR